MNISLFSLSGALASLFAFFLIRSLGMHGWSTSKKSILAAGFTSAFTMNFFLFQIIFSEKSLPHQLIISIIFSFIIAISFYLVSKNHVTMIFTRILLINGLMTALITLSLMESFEVISESIDSFTFNNLSLAYQTPSILIIFLLIYLLDKRLFKIASKNKYIYIIYNSLFFISVMVILFWPVSKFYIQFLTLPFALILGYIAFCFATHMFSHHVKHSQ